ncbi:Venom allergen 5 [Frankliniella fusca]|uniref:Venom allergen 5 n=1 Tax=Frankliniella fusca TaxID=407009 RepID=A0AAE1H4A9_9NEOP|nr:Venom allergen 5 [Frankliniella fusca]
MAMACPWAILAMTCPWPLLAMSCPWAALAMSCPWAALAMACPWAALAMACPWAVLAIAKKSHEQFTMAVWPMGSAHGRPWPWFSFATGHFSQVVWGDTHLVGCGRARYEENGLPTQLLVCNYGPGGNVETEPLYRGGAPCSGCPAGQGCSATYPALCAPGQQHGQQGVASTQAAEPAPAPLSLRPSAPAAPAAPAASIGLRSFFANPTENSILPSSPAPGGGGGGFFAGSTAKPFFPSSTGKPFPSLKPFTTAKPSFTTARTTPRTTTPRTTTARALSTPKPTTARPSTTARPTTARTTVTKPTTALGVRSSASTTLAPVIASSTAAPEEVSCPIPKSVGPACKEYRAAPLSAAERAAMLDFHNVKRSELASGKVPGFKPASDMKQMYWDDELQELAQAWADKCEWGHDPCRNTARWSVKGQNLGLTFSLDWRFPASTERVEDWFQELKLYNYSSGPFTFTPATSHFTQLAWSDSYLVGCGRARYMSEHGLPSEYLVCNYGPGGNIFGNALYREGEPCSRCRDGCSDRYPGLCTRSTRSEDTNEVSAPLLPALRLDEPSSAPFLHDEQVPAAASSTACPRPAAPGPNCIGHRAAPLSPDEKILLLHRHNFYRSQVAGGVVPGLPAAAAMLQMVWDDEVAALAQRWADQCSFGYDECAKTDEFRLGQSMAIWYSQDLKLFPGPEGRVEGWFNERSQANLTALIEDFKFSPTAAAFSQLAWADTWKLGCGRSRYSSVPGVLTEILVCNYGPGGNVQGGRMYRPGPACSACPAACSTSYPGLCATA